VVIKGVVFDMDDTLYLERDYVRSGFQAVATHVSDMADESTVFQTLWTLFQEGIRGNTFNLLMETMPGLAERTSIPQLVSIYRNHIPDIAILPAMRTLLIDLRNQGLPLGLLSDGPLAAQQAKVDALGLETLVDSIVLTDAWGRDKWKPNPAGFERLAQTMDVEHKFLVYIGDNPVKDFIAPRTLGWRTIRLRMPGQLRETDEPTSEAATPDNVVSTMEALRTVLHSDH